MRDFIFVTLFYSVCAEVCWELKQFGVAGFGMSVFVLYIFIGKGN